MTTVTLPATLPATLPSALQHRLESVLDAAAPRTYGQVVGVRGLSIVIRGLAARIGDLVEIGEEESPRFAEVVAVDGDAVSALPLGPLDGIGSGDRVVSTGGPLRIAVGHELRGRVLDGLARPIDGRPAPSGLHRVSVEMAPPPALDRALVTTPLSVGVRAIDTLTPVGRGQRVGIFAGSGVGKSSLLSMITRGSSASITIVALIGERGREVNEFIQHTLGPEGLKNAIVVVATSDQPPMVRLRAAFVATRLAEWFRDDGQDVLLLLDSITRLAMAQREIGLSVGEPPATRGYPPSVFAMLPRLLERTGAAARGSITAMYSVLVEGDDHSEPIADTARSILDGHIVLDRRLATAGHFPSIEVLESVSRVSGSVTTPEQRAIATTTRQLLAARRDVRELVEIGAYVAGTNPTADRALALWPQLQSFLRQDMAEQVPTADSWQQLGAIVRAEPQS